MRRKNLYKRVIAWSMVAAMSLMSIGMVGCASATDMETENAYNAEAAELEGFLEEATVKKSESNNLSSAKSGKEETVYVICDANGNKKDVIVSEWLKNGNAVGDINDVSELSDIKNVKGDEEYTPSSGDKLTWSNLGNDIYYEGTTNKETPVAVKVSYFLDGKEMTADEIAGKAGRVTIRFDYINNSKVGDVYTPFVMATGMILSNDTFSNVTVKNGKVISDGNRQIVVGLGMPGLAESLKLDEKDNYIPEFVEVSADTDAFELAMTVTFASTGLFGDETGDLDLESVKEDVNEMTDELMDGVTKLADGIKDYTDGVSELNGYLKQADDGAAQLYEGSTTLKNGIKDAKNGADTIISYYEGENGLVAGAKKLSDGTEQLNQAVSGLSVPSIEVSDEQKAQAAEANKQRVTSYLTGDSAKAQIMGEIDATFAAFAEENGITPDNPYYATFYATYAKAYSTAYASAYPAGYTSGYTNASQDVLAIVQESVSGITGQLDTLKEAVATLNNGTGTLYNGVLSIYGGTKQLEEGLAALDSGAGTLNSKLGEFSSATNQIYEGSNKLVSYNADLVDGSSELKDKTTEVIDDSNDMEERLEALKDASVGYQSFGGKSDDVEGNVKFIFKTDAIGK